MVVRFFYGESFFEAEPKGVFARLGVQPHKEKTERFFGGVFKERQSIVL